MADPVKNLIPGFDPNRSNNYVLKPNTTPTTTGGATPKMDAPTQSGWSAWDLVPSSQTVRDVADRTFNNVLLGYGDNITSAWQGKDLATLRALREQMNQRMSPAAKVTADVLGQINPTQVLNAVPVVGPTLQGAAQEGVRAYAAGRDPRTILADTVMGGVGGTAARAFGSPKALGQLLGTGVETGLPAAAGYALGGNLEHGLLGGLLGSQVFKPAGDAVRGLGNAADEWAGPAAKQALQNLIMGGASSFIQNNPQPPPLPGFGYPGN